MNDGSCRRAQQRYDLEMEVKLVHEGQTATVVTRNVSLGGMFLDMQEPLPFGAVVHVTFSLPELDSPVEVDAIVRWVDPGKGVGVQFAGLRAREVWAMQQLLSATS